MQRGYSGVFHLAIHLRSEAGLARVLARLRAFSHHFGASDQIIAKSLYLHDPDGIGLEIAFETPERVRSYEWTKGTDGPLVIDWEGRNRRGIGTNLYRLGVPEKTIQAILRHANVSTTTTYYIQTAASDAQAAMAKLESELMGNESGPIPNGQNPVSDYSASI